MKNIISLSILVLFLSSCASPKVVNVIGPNDSSMNCKELSDEIAKANKYFNEAQEQKKMDKGHNIVLRSKIGIGEANCILSERGYFFGAADSRRGAVAKGY